MQFAKHLTIIETIIRKNRFYVKLDLGNGQHKTLPRAHFIWLSSNPAFEEIPLGYVIHHLDGDQTNDDPSNLALMQKHHHAAHHWKQKALYPEVKIKQAVRCNRYREEFYPIEEPKITWSNIKKRFCLNFAESMDGKRFFVRKYSYRGRSFKTHEDAQWAKAQIWHKRKVCPKCNGEGLL